MREIIEFRIPEEHAARHLPDDLGQRLGETVRRVVLNIDDPWVVNIGRLSSESKKNEGFFFSSWEIRRSYSRLSLIHI